ncbi:MAG: sulfotransferase [Maritimibacter sp.]|nr:sulfotransferase [Maritimibacter sp.]
MSVDSMIRKAQGLARAGDHRGAAAVLKQVLAKSPGNKSALRGLAALARANGALPPARGRATAPAGPQPTPQALRGLERLLARPDPAAAIAEAKRLSLMFPASPPVFNLLGLALTQARRFDAALKAFDRYAELLPNSTAPQINRANVLLAAERYEDAAEAAAAARALDPKLARAAQLQGFALSKARHYAAAETAFRDAIRLSPKATQGHLGLGHVLSATRRNAEALVAYRAALEIDPGNAEAANNVGAMLVALNRLDEAVAVLAPAVEAHPGNRMLRSNIAKALRDLDRAEEAITHLDAALESGPETGALLATKVSCLSTIGDIDAARVLLVRAIELDPHNPDLQIVRSQLDPGGVDAAERDRMAAALDDEALPEKTRAALAYGLFRVSDAAGDTEAAAESLARGNAMKRRLNPYDIEADARHFAALEKMFGAPGAVLSETDVAEIPSRHRFVFIVGMPRSGTTLVEQILASHSQVHGAGELRLLAAAMKEIGWSEDRIGGGPTVNNLRKLRRSYIAGIEKRGIDADVVTDKMPLNFRHLGHALAAFPDARALVLDRDARAVCWSNWSHDFRGAGNGFGNDLGDLARMYRMHRALVDRYRAAYPDRVATVPYERLTEHQEEESRKLVAAAGLDWEPACLDFHETRRAVRTASSVQVRQKMYTGSSEAWRRYEAHLGPLLAALAEA